jgi:hypothetical protein
MSPVLKAAHAVAIKRFLNPKGCDICFNQTCWGLKKRPDNIKHTSIIYVSAPLKVNNPREVSSLAKQLEREKTKPK